MCVIQTIKLSKATDMNRKGLLRNRLVIGFSLFLSFTATILAANPTTDTIPLRDRKGDFLRDSVVNPFDLRDPAIIQHLFE